MMTKLPYLSLARFVTNFGTRTESLKIMHIEGISNFLRTLSTGSYDTELTTWPNLRVLDLRGSHTPALKPALLDLPVTGDGPGGLLCAMSVALVSFPRLRDANLKLSAWGERSCNLHVTARLHLCNESAKLTVELKQSECWEEGDRSRLPPKKPLEFWEALPEVETRAASAGLQAAVRTHRGLDLEIVFLETIHDDSRSPGTRH